VTVEAGALRGVGARSGKVRDATRRIPDQAGVILAGTTGEVSVEP